MGRTPNKDDLRRLPLAANAVEISLSFGRRS